MLRPNMIDEDVMRQHRADLLREAQQIHMAQEAEHAQGGAEPPILWRLYAPPLALLGRWLMSWGTKLTQQYGARLRADAP